VEFARWLCDVHLLILQQGEILKSLLHSQLYMVNWVVSTLLRMCPLAPWRAPAHCAAGTSENLVKCLIFIGHFQQKSPIISGSFAENDLQLQTSALQSVVYIYIYIHIYICTHFEVESVRWLCGARLLIPLQIEFLQSQYIYTYIWIHIYINIYIQICTYTYVYTYTYIYKYVHIYINTHIYIYITCSSVSCAATNRLYSQTDIGKWNTVAT